MSFGSGNLDMLVKMLKDVFGIECVWNVEAQTWYVGLPDGCSKFEADSLCDGIETTGIEVD